MVQGMNLGLHVWHVNRVQGLHNWHGNRVEGMKVGLHKWQGNRLQGMKVGLHKWQGNRLQGMKVGLHNLHGIGYRDCISGKEKGYHSFMNVRRICKWTGHIVKALTINPHFTKF